MAAPRSGVLTSCFDSAIMKSLKSESWVGNNKSKEEVVMKYYHKLSLLAELLNLKGKDKESAKVAKAAEDYLTFITYGEVDKAELLKTLDEIDKQYELVIWQYRAWEL